MIEPVMVTVRLNCQPQGIPSFPAAHGKETAAARLSCCYGQARRLR